MLRGVVGWAAADGRGASETGAERLAGRAKLRGVRHVVQDEPDAAFILRKDFNEGVAALHDFKLRYDILIFRTPFARRQYLWTVILSKPFILITGKLSRASESASSRRGIAICANWRSGKMCTAS